MTVRELFESHDLDAFFISDNFDSEYWTKCSDFIDQNWGEDIEQLSEKQSAWLYKIFDSCIEKKEQLK
jgi:hypothetical protein